MNYDKRMPEGVRRGRPKKVQNQQGNNSNPVVEGDGIATRTRRRRAAAAAAAPAPAPAVNETAAVAAQPPKPVVAQRRQPVREPRREVVADKPMDDLSGGKSGEKANAGDDEGVNAPVPEMVRHFLLCAF